MKSLIYSICTFSFLILLACSEPPVYPDEPIIEFVSLSKSSMQQSFASIDSILVTLSFTDGDGDIGSEPGDSSSIVLYIDKRQNNIQPPRVIPTVGDIGVGKGISGKIFIHLPTSCCIEIAGNTTFTCERRPGITDEVNYEMWIVDRAGNESNRVELPPITLRCD